jgi:GT2 family glycosyltransferase
MASSEPARLRASVCIPTFNRRQALLAVLAGLDRQAVESDRFEVIVAVDGSNDGTVAALAGLRPSFALRWLVQPNAGPAAARNAAAKAARHEVLVFLDDDQPPAPELIAAHLAAQGECGPVVVQGAYPLAAGFDRQGASLVYERARAASVQPPAGALGRPWRLWAGNFSVRRTTWLDVGGFDETFADYGGEDTDFGLRVAALAIPYRYEPTALSYHARNVGYGTFRRQAYSEGRASIRLARKHGLELSQIAPTESAGSVNRLLRGTWRVSPALATGIGLLFTAVLWTADRMRIRPAQVGAARIVRRLYKLGGMLAESGRERA